MTTGSPPPPPRPRASRVLLVIGLATALAALITLVAFLALRGGPAGAPPGPSAAATSPPAPDTADAPPQPSARAAPADGRITGVVLFEGEPPVMEVPPDRKYAQHCLTKEIPADDVLVRDGKVKDVLVRIVERGVATRHAPPTERVVVAFRDCMLQPKVQGALVGQKLEIRNEDPTLHNAHLYSGDEGVASEAIQKRGKPVIVDLADIGVLRLTSDLHPWEQAFVAVTDHPYFAVTGEDGAFAIEQVPAGKYRVEAIHGVLGRKRLDVTVDGSTEIRFVFRQGDEAR